MVVRHALQNPSRVLDIIAGVPTDYHRIAGSSLDRLAALSDGIFAVAMTLLVLDLRVPVVEGCTRRRPSGTSWASSRRAYSPIS